MPRNSVSLRRRILLPDIISFDANSKKFYCEYKKSFLPDCFIFNVHDGKLAAYSTINTFHKMITDRSFAKPFS